MKSLKLVVLILVSVIAYNNAASQNAVINILTKNSGMVKKDGTVFLEVTVTNTDAAYSIGVYKIRSQITVPSEIAGIPDTGHVLPPGWTITSNNGSSIFLSNGTAVLDPNSEHTILIAITGKKAGGPSTIIGQLSFSNGNSPGTGHGSLPGDNPADNSSTSTIKVVK